MALHQRELAWEGCLNVRDLGGHPTVDGGETRYGRVVRADSVRQLTEAGWNAVAAYGIRRSSIFAASTSFATIRRRPCRWT